MKVILPVFYSVEAFDNSEKYTYFIIFFPAANKALSNRAPAVNANGENLRLVLGTCASEPGRTRLSGHRKGKTAKI